MEDSLREYPVVLEIPVRFRDLDAMGHVNNAVYLTYFEEARVAYLRAAFGDIARPEDFDFVVAESLCRYHSPAFLGELLEIGVRVEDVGNRSFKFVYRIEDSSTHRLVATGYTVQVAYDYENRKPVSLSDRLIQGIRKVQGSFTRKGEK
jgi:acyl-CoA thioester hydrolase